MVSFQYTISSADTWEYKTITVPAYTAGAFDDDNARSMQIEWWLNSGDTYTGGGSHQTTWAALAQTKRNASNLGIGGAVNDTWQLAGVQLEVGSEATLFEHRSYGDELSMCQRYYQELDLGDNNSVLHMNFTRYSHGSGDPFSYTCFPVTMRAAPSFSFLGSTFNSSGYTGDPTLSAATVNGVQLSGSNNASANATHYLRPNNNSGDFLRLTFNAEL